MAALEANDHPAALIDLHDKYDIGQEFFRWEFAVAAAGAALGINPFNQPDVQLAKDLSKKAMSESGSGAAKLKDEVAVADSAVLAEQVGVVAWQEEGARLCRRAGLHRAVGGKCGETRGDPRGAAKPARRGYDVGFWPALSSFHRTAA